MLTPAVRVKESQPRGVAVRIGAFGLLLSMFLIPRADAGAAEESGDFRVVGRLPVLSPVGRAQNNSSWQVRDAMLVLDPTRRRAYQFFHLGPIDPAVGIRVFDLDSLRPLGYARFDGQAFSLNGEWAYAHDEETGRFFVPLIKPASPQTEPRFEIAIVDQERIERGVDPVVSRMQVPAEHRITMTGTTPIGLTFDRDPASGRGKLLLYVPGHAEFAYGTTAGLVGATFPYLAQWDAETGAADWLIQGLQLCRNGFLMDLNRSRAPIFRSSDGTFLYTICNVSGWVAAAVRIPLEGGVPVADQALYESFPGPVRVTEAWGDPKAERLVMIASGTGVTGQQAWVFDGTVSRYVGAAGLTQYLANNGYGFDAQTGRLYVLAPDHAAAGDAGDGTGRPTFVQGGLMVIDTRSTPVPQPLNFPQYMRLGEPAIRIDPPAPGRPRRLFLRRAVASEEAVSPGDSGNLEQYHRYPDGKLVDVKDEGYYLVLEDSVPQARQPTLDDLDRFTVDVAEQEGITQASFEGAGSAYGVRARIVGGIGTLVRNSQTEVWEQALLQRNEALSPCWFTDREAIVAWAQDSRLSDLTATAASVPIDINGSSKVDAERPAERCETTPTYPDTVPAEPPPLPWSDIDDLAGQRWDDSFAGAECVGDAENNAPVAIDAFSGRAACRQEDGQVESTARGAVEAGGIRVGEAYAAVRVIRNPEDGVALPSGETLERVVRVESLAQVRNVVIGEGSIDLVQAQAVVWSNGRPNDGSARARFSRIFCGVRAPGLDELDEDGCLTEEQMNQVLPEFNRRALGQRGEIRLPSVDADLEAGSPKGYVAGITKRSADVFNDQLLNGDYQLEVPALEVILYRDSSYFGPGRQIIQVAGVRGVATYGISCLPPLGFKASAGRCVQPPPVPDPTFEESPAEGPPIQDPAGPSSSLQPESPPPSYIERVIRGARELVVRSLTEGLLAAGVWLTLGLPLFFASRRNALARLFGSSREA